MRMMMVPAIGVMLAAPAWAEQPPSVQVVAPMSVQAPGWRHPDPHVWELASSPAAWSLVWRQVNAQDWALRRRETTRS